MRRREWQLLTLLVRCRVYPCAERNGMAHKMRPQSFPVTDQGVRQPDFRVKSFKIIAIFVQNGGNMLFIFELYLLPKKANNRPDLLFFYLINKKRSLLFLKNVPLCPVFHVLIFNNLLKLLMSLKICSLAHFYGFVPGDCVVGIE